MSDNQTARILIVDDSLINRKKLSMAVASLGYETETASDGASAIAAMRERNFDTVLLDLLMPEMDGFEVLDNLKSDEILRELPVIVISDLEGDTEAVTRAIELGAEDFLPKRFDPAILKARLTACLRKKQFRDQELAYFQRIDTLTEAAAKVEAGRFDDQSLGLHDEAKIADPLGRLALVFQGMAGEIHAREAKLLQRIQTLQAGLILLLNGALIGVIPALSRMAFNLGSNPFGLAACVDLLAAAIFLLFTLMRRSFPKLSGSDIKFFVAWAFLVGILQHLTIFILAEHVEATYLTLVMALESLLVFVFAASTGMESASGRRILGLLVGLAGITLALYQKFTFGISDQKFWLIVALITPVIYALETLALSARRPKHIDPFSSIGLMFVFSAAFAVPLAVFTGNVIPVSALFSPLGVLIVAITVISIAANVSFIYLLNAAGPVFASQTAYVSALSGIIWGMLLLGERLSMLAWVAVAIVLGGMYLVESKTSNKPIMIKRKFTT